jgi:protein SCO1/2
MKSPRYLYWVLPLFILPLVLVYLYASLNVKKKQPVKTIESFSLVDENNEPFLSDKLKNKVSVISFIFTSCQGQCPLIIHQAKKLLTRFQEPKFQVVSISVDPKVDTPQVLKEYKTKNNIDRRHVFLTGPQPKIKAIVEKNFLVSATKSEEDIAHSTNFILVDENANILGYYDAFNKEDINNLSENISLLLQDSKNRT